MTEAAVPPATSEGAGSPALVLLHAFPLDGRMWKPQVEALSSHHQVVVPDLRGFGSARDQVVEVAEMDLLADDVARLLDELGLDQVVLCGLSMGGYVSFAFARRHPGRLRGLVLAATKASADDEQAAAARLAMADRVLAEGIGFVPDAMLPQLLGTSTRRLRPTLVEKVTKLIIEQEPAAVAAAQRGMARRPDVTAELAAISVPALVLCGTEDERFGPEVGRGLAAAIPDATFVQIPEAGHLLNLEQPAQVNEALLDFVAPLWI
ncbi:MAG TPA: alpha/beta fold hydrolase [Actinomycetes bacterium]